jgi:hypothetical protein
MAVVKDSPVRSMFLPIATDAEPPQASAPQAPAPHPLPMLVVRDWPVISTC